MAVQEQQASSASAPPRVPISRKQPRAKARAPELLEVDPTTCRIWTGQQRALDRLNEESCRDLIDSFLSSGTQHTPAFVRRNAGNDGTQYEVIAGSRRLWAANWVREHHLSDFLFPIKVLDLTDEEACWLSDSENRDRHDVSDYERALHYRRVLGSFYETQAEMAVRYNMSETKLSRYLSLADLPIQIPNAFVDWADLKAYYVDAFHKLLKDSKTASLLIKRATQLHMIHEERALAGEKPMTGKQVHEDLCGNAKPKKGGSRGPIKEFTKNDKTLLQVTTKNQSGITMFVPLSSGASVDDIVHSFRRCLDEYYER